MGLFYKKRRGGRFSEKMGTFTVPHFTLEEARELNPESDLVKDCSRGLGDAGLTFWKNDVAARVAALRLARPKFMRSMRRWLSKVDPAGARSLPLLPPFRVDDRQRRQGILTFTSTCSRRGSTKS